MKKLFLLSSAALGCALPLAAQEDTELRVAPVIVSLPGPDRTADELIGNATALERDAIVDTLAATLGDTLDKEPGVSTTAFGQGASRPILRGLGAERVQVLTNGIGVIDASAASPDHQVSADGIDAEKIEILRGPSALAYGGQAIGGVVNVLDGLIVEELPEEAVSGEVFGAYSSVNEGGEGAARARFTAGDFVFALSASARDFGDYDIPGYAESDAFRAAEEAEHEHEEEEREDEDHEDEDHDHEEEEEAYGVLPNSFLETQTLAAGLSWVGESASFGISVRNQTSEYGIAGHSHEHEHEDEEEEHEDEDHEDEDHDHEEEHEHGEESPFIDLDHTRVDLRGRIHLHNDMIRDIAGWVSIVDYEHTEFEGPGEPGTRFETSGYEGRVEADYGDETVGGAVGVQFLDKSFEALGDEAFITPTDTTSYALFLYHSAELNDRAGIEGGARVDHVKVDNKGGLGQETFDLVSGSLGYHRHVGEHWFVGGSLSYTERAPTDVELYADGPHLATSQYEVGNADLDKEKGTSLEGTARWKADNFSFGVNLFASSFSDFIYLTPGVTMEDGELVDEADGLDVYLFSQDDVDFFGGELYGAYYAYGPLGADWEFTAGLDYVSSDVSGGGNLPLQPPLTLNLGAEGVWGVITAGADVTFADEQDEPGAGELPTDGYTRLDLHAEYALTGFGKEGSKLFIEARNLTDEEIRVSTSPLKDVITQPGQNIRAGLRLAF